MKRLILALLLFVPSVGVAIQNLDPLPQCFPCPPTDDTRSGAAASATELR